MRVAALFVILTSLISPSIYRLSCFFMYSQAAQNSSHYSQFGLTIGKDDVSGEDVEIFDLDINPKFGKIIALGSLKSTFV